MARDLFIDGISLHACASELHSLGLCKKQWEHNTGAIKTTIHGASEHSADACRGDMLGNEVAASVEAARGRQAEVAGNLYIISICLHACASELGPLRACARKKWEHSTGSDQNIERCKRHIVHGALDSLQHDACMQSSRALRQHHCHCRGGQRCRG